MILGQWRFTGERFGDWLVVESCTDVDSALLSFLLEDRLEEGREGWRGKWRVVGRDKRGNKQRGGDWRRLRSEN